MSLPLNSSIVLVGLAIHISLVLKCAQVMYIIYIYIECPTLCEECTPEGCITCQDGEEIHENPIMGACKCKDGYYEVDNKCKICHKSCIKCEGGNSNGNCLPGWCIENYYSYYNSTSNTHTCLLRCEGLPHTHLFHNPTTNTCENCHPNCKECINNSNTGCSTCLPPYLHSPTMDCTHTSCPPGTLLILNNIYIYICESCHVTCAECANELNYCVSCVEGLYRQGGDCVGGCSLGFGEAVDGGGADVCLPCDFGCLLCTFSGGLESRCDLCLNTVEFFLVEGVCENSCPFGTFGDNLRGLCVTCHEACSQCSGPTDFECLYCNQDKGYTKLLPNNICSQEKCISGEYFENTTYSCNSNYIYIYILLLLLLLECHQRCKECKGPKVTDCRSCGAEYSWNPMVNLCQKCEEYLPGLVSLRDSNGCLGILYNIYTYLPTN